jgi:hypothetical protein
MDDCNELPWIHQRMAAALAELGRPEARCHRTQILIRKGFCLGRQFEYEGVRVVWLIDQAELDLYDDDGQLLKRVSLADEPSATRQAA